MKPDEARGHGKAQAQAQAQDQDQDQARGHGHARGLGPRQALQAPRSDSAAGTLPSTPATLAYLGALHDLLDWAPAAMVPRRQKIKFGKLRGRLSNCDEVSRGESWPAHAANNQAPPTHTA